MPNRYSNLLNGLKQNQSVIFNPQVNSQVNSQVNLQSSGLYSPQFNFTRNSNLTNKFAGNTIQFYDPLTGKLGPTVNTSNNEAVNMFNNLQKSSTINNIAQQLAQEIAVSSNPISIELKKMIMQRGGVVKKYTGSGVLLLELNHKLNTVTVLLFRSNNYIFEDCGGKLEKNSNLTLEENAKKELYEETSQLFNIDSLNLNLFEYIDIENDNSLYRCYIVCMKNVYNNLIDTFIQNQQILKKLNFPDSYFEMNLIQRFDLNDISKKINNNENVNLNENFLYGKAVIRSRTYKILKHLLMNKSMLQKSVTKSVQSKIVQLDNTNFVIKLE